MRAKIMKTQVDLIHMKPLPPPPEPMPNVLMYCETITEVEEYWKNEQFIERPTAKEITTKTFYCKYAFFDSDGICHGGCDSDADIAVCMKVPTSLLRRDEK